MKIVSVSPARRGCHQELVAVVRALFLARKLRPGRRPQISLPNSRETEQLLKEAVEFAVQEYGERSLPELEADRVAVAAEKHQQTTRHPKVGRSIIVSVTSTNNSGREHEVVLWWFARNWDRGRRGGLTTNCGVVRGGKAT